MGKRQKAKGNTHIQTNIPTDKWIDSHSHIETDPNSKRQRAIQTNIHRQVDHTERQTNTQRGEREP